MPNVDGIEAARTISAESIAPVVMLTAFSQAGLVEDAARAGRDGLRGQAVHDATTSFRRCRWPSAGYAETACSTQQVDDLTERLETRKLLDRAKGILMAGGLSEPEAFKRLQKLAMDKRRSLRDVAQAVITADELQK